MASTDINTLLSQFLGQTPLSEEKAIDRLRSQFISELLTSLSTELVTISLSDVIMYMKKCKEDDFVFNILLPLLRNMGFQKVRAKGHREKILEYGQDLRGMKLLLPTGNTVYFVAQVKAGTVDINSKSKQNNAEMLLTQTRMAFEKTFFDPDVNLEVRADHVLLIASGIVTEQARLYIHESISKEKRRNVMFLDCEDIVDLCRKYGLPYSNQEDIAKYLKSISKARTSRTRAARDLADARLMSPMR